MNNHPFFSTNTNIYDQSVFSSAPTNLNGQNVLVSQEQQRKMFDTLNTSIMGLPYNNPPQMYPYSGNFIQAQKQFIPGGVMFSFNLPPPPSNPQVQFMSQQVHCCPPQQHNFFPLTLEQQKHGLETLQYQQQLASNPFQLKFHFDIGTSCSDLLYGPTQIPGSRGTPDFTNIGGVLQMQNQQREQLNPADTQYSLSPVDTFRNIKRLTLNKPPKKCEGHVIDCVNIDGDDSTRQNESSKKVSFAGECQENKGKEDKSEQALLGCCTCCNSQNCENSKEKPVSKKAKSQSKGSVLKKKGNESSDSDEEDSQRRNKKKNNKKHKKVESNHKLYSRRQSDSQYCSTEEDSD